MVALVGSHSWLVTEFIKKNLDFPSLGKAYISESFYSITLDAY